MSANPASEPGQEVVARLWRDDENGDLWAYPPQATLEQPDASTHMRVVADPVAEHNALYRRDLARGAEIEASRPYEKMALQLTEACARWGWALWA